MKQLLLLSFLLFGNILSNAQTVSTFAGSGNSGFFNGPADEAEFFNLEQMVMDDEGNVYICDRGNHVIRKIDTDGIVSTFAGLGVEGDQVGPKETALFNLPTGIAIGPDGTFYIVDTGNHKIKKITSDGNVELIAGSGLKGYKDGAALEAEFRFPTHACVDEFNNLYIAGNNNNSIRKIDLSTNIVSTFAGKSLWGFEDGIGSEASFDFPQGLAIDKENNLYVGDKGNNAIRKITPEGVVTTLAGNGNEGYVNGIGAEVEFAGPKGVAVDANGNVYVADRLNYVVRKIDTDGMVSTVAGFPGISGYLDGDATTSSLIGRAVDVICDREQNVLITDWGNHVIRKLTNELSSVEEESALNSNSSMVVYPNPASDIITISGNLEIDFRTYVSDLSGRKVLATKNQATINVSDLSPGIYMVTVQGENYNKTEKLIIR